MERSDQRAAAGAALSVVIPTLNAAAGLPTTLACLNQHAAGDLALEVIVSDGGSRDDTRALAAAA
ncbi:MAG: glycosyltransferase, partial [Pseudomonadota bacterium]|nr:glycosyltransferase [Pseudomonadota bacterium]